MLLQNIHDKAQGWIAYAIVGLIAVPFALFGINQYFDGSSKLVAAKVNGEDIPVQQVQDALQNIKQQFGGKLPPGMDDSLKQTALDSVINEALMRQSVKNGGFRASDIEVVQAITDIPNFQKDGVFDKTIYENYLKMQRRDSAEFEAKVRESLSQKQLSDSVLNTAFLPKAQLEQYQVLKTQQRDLELFTLKLDDFKAQTKITEPQVAAYYDKNKAQFMTEERVKVAYIELDSTKLAEQVKIEPATLEQWFKDNADHYVTPEERNVSHIVVNVDDPSKDADAKKRIEALYADLQANKRSFEVIAKADSDDKSTAEKDGLMGAVVADDWGPEFNKAVQALKAGEVSKPVKTEAGYEIIRVNTVKPAEKQTYEQAKSRVETDYRKEQADKAFAEKSKQLENLAYENEGDLAPVAKGLGLTIQESEWFTRKQGQGIAISPKVRAAAFTEDVLKSGKNSEPVETEDSHVVVLRKANYEASAQKPLDMVKQDIVQRLGEEEARKLTKQKGEELFKKLSAGQDWKGISELSLGDEKAVEKVGFVGRTDNKVSPDITEKAFNMIMPAQDKVTWSNLSLSNGDYSIIRLKAVKPGEAKIDEAITKQYDQDIGSRELNAVLESLREKADIVKHPENL
jgi:peptidyl-prolyl cis-trans isomerase D